ncbi:zinc finger CCCH domain-containing protein 23-like [Chenopodium quinoa]|uniref:zinc finger CCCH domain-containing protein 23-like n=1 Tax=Chenopodium quinoa TaxID=63459 RepID=UPI000B785223|nr:zinc finger CCCH domain-containing protein 23-like [Chenopodium quinoa]
MYRVDVENMLREYSNAYDNRTRYPNPFADTDFEPDNFESDEFRMYSFKVKRCPLMRAHDWTICPYAHQGERARRRDLKKVLYVAVSCPDYRASSGNCPRGELCEYAHGVFEYWLHPTKYRTRFCNAGNRCTRPICFFAHSLKQLRAEPMAHIPKWVRLALRTQQLDLQAPPVKPSLSATSAATRISSTSGGREVGVIGRPRTSNTAPTPTSALWELQLASSSSTTTSSSAPPRERPQELKLEFLETLRMLNLSDYYKVYNNNQVENNNVNRENGSRFDWVSDLLAG